MNKKYTKRIAVTASLTAVALMFAYVEALIPIPIGIPGVKLGLANIAVVCAMFIMDTRCAAEVNTIRIILSAVLFSSPSVLMYALAGAAAGFIAMTVMKRCKFDIITVSAVGGVFHNVGQTAVFAVVSKTPCIMYWLIILFAVGLITGIAVGAVSMVIVKAVNKKFIR
ncbi:MAG: Gx transporter family protein [Clostridia bacterium]|nr:Gx transporter family protein [Clostridia bacterium]